MVADGAISTRTGRWRRPVVVAASLAASMSLLGWIPALAVTLPSRYTASHWNVARATATVVSVGLAAGD